MIKRAAKLLLIIAAVVVVLLFAAYGLMALGILWGLDHPERNTWLG